MTGEAEFRRAGALGFPVSHSLSPQLHRYWLNTYHIAGSYEALSVAPGDLGETLRMLASQGFQGVNLTLPHKEKALALMDEIDASAKYIGAVNTILMKEGRLLGSNTDTYGFTANLKAHMHDIPSGNALVLGAGGAARAVCAGLLAEGWNINIAGRTAEKARMIAESFKRKISPIKWQEIADAMGNTMLLVNTTPLGMKGNAPLDITLDPLPDEAWVCDIVYAPERTPMTQNCTDPTTTDLLARAMQRNLKTIGGLGMLLYQAQPAFEAWFGIRPEVTDDLYRHMQGALA